MQRNASADTLPSPCSCFTAFELSAIFSSHTTSLLTRCSCDVMYCRNTWIVNMKMSAKSGRNMLTIAAPWRMTTCTTGVGELSCTGTRSSMQPPRSESTSCHRVLPLRVQCQALGKIFGFLRSHVPNTLFRKKGSMTARCLTRTSTWKVDALRKDSPTGDMRQKKHVSVEGGASSTDWRENFLETSVSSSMWYILFSARWSVVLLNCNLHESCYLALCCLKLPQCLHHHLTLTGWLS